MTTIDTSTLSTIEDNVKYTMLQLMHEILKSYNQSLDIITDLNSNQIEMNEKIDKNADDIDTIQGNYELVLDSIERLDGQMNATWPSELNRKINANTDSINSLGDDVSTHTQQLAGTAQSGLLTKINANTDSINSLEDNVSTHTQQLAGTAQSGLLTKINTNAQAINQWAQETQQNSTDISTNMNSIESLESKYASLSASRGYLPDPVIYTCNNSDVKQRGDDNYWSISIPTPAGTTTEGRIMLFMNTDILSNAGRNPLYLTFDDGSGIYTQFFPFRRFETQIMSANILGELPGNLITGVLVEDPINGGLCVRVISVVATA